MILPFFIDFLSLKKAPITWLLIILNFLMLATHMDGIMYSQNGLDKHFHDEYFLVTNGRLFAQFVNHHEESYSASIKQMVAVARNGKDDSYKILGSMAFRDERFLREGLAFEFKGDLVAIEKWRQSFKEFKQLMEYHPNYNLGVVPSEFSVIKWVTYQFMHTGMTHFFGNMFFLALFGSMLEPVIGGLAVLAIYLISGMIAAGSFLYFTDFLAVPLVGASGAVSGLMALFCVLFWNKSVRYIYFLFIPKRGYAGYIYLPGWITLVMWAVSDLAGFLSTPDELGGVAYSAHLGGDLAGLLAGLIFAALRFRQLSHFVDDRVFSEKPSPPLGTKIA